MRGEWQRSKQVFLKKFLSILLLLVLGPVFNSVCTAAPLMVERNLFATDRKPPSPDSADTSSKSAKPGMAVGNIQLDGVIIQSNVKRAVLRMKNPPAGAAAKKGQPTSPFVTVREGQVVSDYRVSKIESKSISLEKDGQTFTISLFAENKVVLHHRPHLLPPPRSNPSRLHPKSRRRRQEPISLQVFKTLTLTQMLQPARLPKGKFRRMCPIPMPNRV